MDPSYLIRDTSSLMTPSLVFYRSKIAANIDRLLRRVGGDPNKLRPHCKTHKTREIVRMQMDRRINKHKAATIAEAEMLAGVGAPDVLISYPLIGPNCARLAKLIAMFPGCRFSTLADHAVGVRMLSKAMTDAGAKAEIYVDLDVGQHRTGVSLERAAAVVTEIVQSPGLSFAGLHVYDGHNHAHEPAERRKAAQAIIDSVTTLKNGLKAAGIETPHVVLGGTPSFPAYASIDWADAECSPGTCVLNDSNYRAWFADLDEFEPAALLLTRVVSRPTPDRVCLDLGYKAVASDPPAGKRCVLWNMPGAEAVLHNEEHLVVTTPDAEKYEPGDIVYAQPAHVCPTSALHQFVYVAEGGEIVDRWTIAARDRMLTV